MKTPEEFIKESPLKVQEDEIAGVLFYGADVMKLMQDYAAHVMTCLLVKAVNPNPKSEPGYVIVDVGEGREEVILPGSIKAKFDELNKYKWPDPPIGVVGKNEEESE